MTPSCDRCTCHGAGTCPICQRIKTVVAAESKPPARRAPASTADFLAASTDRGRLVTAARRALDNLTVLQRQALMLRLVDRLPTRQVATRLGLPGAAVPGLVAAAETKLACPNRGVTS